MAEKSAKAPREPRPGDAILFCGYTTGDEDRPGFAAHCVGTRITLAYMTRSGSWLSGHLCQYDSTGKEPGTWRWPS